MNNEITITAIRIDDHSVPVPHGLSDLVNKSNAWSILTEKPELKGYRREVIMKAGKLMTVLTKVI